MLKVDVDDYTEQSECIYGDETYSVRDNGAVLRHHRIGKRVRPSDNVWTFGKINSSNPYLLLAGVRIHRIVATAFHGAPINPQYVVDHIDTNARNNRPENLRWVTKLENALMNPITRKRIEYTCGSIEAFLENPSLLSVYDVDKNTAWMRTVTPEEAKNCMERMHLWANSDRKPQGGSLGEWVYKPVKQRVASNEDSILDKAIARRIQNNKLKQRTSLYNLSDKKPIEAPLNEALGEADTEQTYIQDSDLVMALTKRCAQRNWRVPSYFPCCPSDISINFLDGYFHNLKVGAQFAYNDAYPVSNIVEFTKSNNDKSILVMCEREGIKPWSIAEVTFEDGLFVHSNLGSYFDKEGADKKFCIAQGLEWNGGDTFDDFC